MQLSISAATAICRTAAVLLPVVYQRDQAQARSESHGAQADQLATEIRSTVRRLAISDLSEEQLDKEHALLEVSRDRLDSHREQEAKYAQMSQGQIGELKKLTHSTKDREEFRLASRKVRRAAVRLVERDAHLTLRAGALADTILVKCTAALEEGRKLIADNSTFEPELEFEVPFLLIPYLLKKFKGGIMKIAHNDFHSYTDQTKDKRWVKTWQLIIDEAGMFAELAS